MCHDQVRVSSMGDIIGLDNKSVIATLELYASEESERKQIFEDILFIRNIEQESKKEGLV